MKTVYSTRFVVLTSLFVTCLIVSNVIAGRLIEIGGIILPGAVILFPVTYIIGDILTEVYGFRRAKLAIWVGFMANVVLAAFSYLTTVMPAPVFFTEGAAAYSTVLAATPRVIAASLIAWWTGEIANAIILSRLKVITKGRFLWVRTIGSTIVGEALDTGLFVAIAFWGIVPLPALLTMMLAQYLVKIAYEVIITPITYQVVRRLKQTEKIDTYDQGISYNPFAFSSTGAANHD